MDINIQKLRRLALIRGAAQLADLIGELEVEVVEPVPAPFRARPRARGSESRTTDFKGECRREKRRESAVRKGRR